MSENAIALKAAKVDEVAEKLKSSKASVFVDVRGLTVEQNTNLRNQLRAENVSLEVVKNNILKRAAEKAGLSGLEEMFVGPSAVAFATEDEIAPSRILKNFSKEAESLELKGGVVNGEVADLDTINKYASLPSRDQLLGQLMAEFQYSIRSFMYAVKAVTEKRESEGESMPEPEKATEATATETPVAAETADQSQNAESVEEVTETVVEEQVAEAEVEAKAEEQNGDADNA